MLNDFDSRTKLHVVSIMACRADLDLSSSQCVSIRTPCRSITLISTSSRLTSRSTPTPWLFHTNLNTAFVLTGSDAEACLQSHTICIDLEEWPSPGLAQCGISLRKLSPHFAYNFDLTSVAAATSDAHEESLGFLAFPGDGCLISSSWKLRFLQRDISRWEFWTASRLLRDSSEGLNIFGTQSPGLFA